MKKYSLVLVLLLILTIASCGKHPSSTLALSPTQTETTIPTETKTPTVTFAPTEIPNLKFTATPVQGTTDGTDSIPQATVEELPDSVTIDGDTLIFMDWGFTIDIPQDVWYFDPTFYKKESDFEGFVFLRNEAFTNSDGEIYRPSIGVLFYKVPKDTDLINFSVILRTHLGSSFPTIDKMFGYEGSEPQLKIPALGYFGHLQDDYSVYTVHTVHGTNGIQVSCEIVDSVMDQAQPEFYEVLQSMDFLQ